MVEDVSNQKWLQLLATLYIVIIRVSGCNLHCVLYLCAVCVYSWPVLTARYAMIADVRPSVVCCMAHVVSRVRPSHYHSSSVVLTTYVL